MIKRIILFMINHFFPSFLFKTNDNKIVVDSFLGRPYSGNGKYVVDELLKFNRDLDIVWLDLHPNHHLYPRGVRVVKYNSLRSVYELATAKVWLDDFRKKYFPKKKKDQIYIQLWHGSVTLKHVERDIENSLGKVYLREAMRDGKNSNYMVSGNAKSTELYKSKFWFSGDVLEFGTPRLDSVINYKKSDLEILDKQLNISADEHVFLYAPTFRDDGSNDVYQIPFTSIREGLEQKFGGRWRIVLRLHPNIANLEDKFVKNDDIIGASHIADAQGLVLRADIVVTDYSSIMFDAMYANKPVFLYAPDLEKYTESRGMYFSISELPFPFSLTINKLLKNIKDFNRAQYDARVSKFQRKIGSVELGCASHKLAQFILNLTKDD